MQPSAIDQSDNSNSLSSVLGEEGIRTISESLFETMLNMEFDADPADPVADWSDALVGKITIDGDLEAEIRVIASQELARRIACKMFAITDDEIAEEDILDAMGEVANIIGGNAKGIFDGDCKLSLPCVGTMDDFSELDAQSQNFDCDGHRFEVQVS